MYIRVYIIYTKKASKFSETKTYKAYKDFKIGVTKLYS